jgi:hypothetical protein
MARIAVRVSGVSECQASITWARSGPIGVTYPQILYHSE